MKKRIDLVKVKMVRESSVMYGTRELNSPSKIADLCKTFLEDCDRENLILVCLNTKLNPTCVSTISVGSLDSSVAHPREIFKTAILSNSAYIVLAHNHPSGNSKPSKEDINITVRVKEGGKILGIQLLDHIIIGDNEYTSLKEENLF